MIQPIQLILFIILGFAVSRVYLRSRDGSISFWAFIFWMGVFFLFGLGVIEPGYATLVANKLGIGRGVDVAVYISIVVLFYLIFRTNVMIENMRHEITKLTQYIALLEKEIKTKKR